ncbi:hypothetical protein KOW79_018021 [Hemibagrus wyckioides]|uniref:Myb-like domain-containing protein n=1 Tax=Hemibagrus wyckioides TaxID=337641 RepID=A0A9D3N7S3_9TELE|nr:transcription termination factor 1-like [Hemibagrus wyckioides]KAG7318266.1 hypothetical protein KOW79_018021 [Hemibagrus wyckioides]
MGKNKEEKKRKSGVFLETAPVCPPVYENLQKDHLQTTSHNESPIKDISVSLESSLEKPKKKKHKRKHLSEQQAENERSTEQHAEVHQDDTEKKKKKKKLRTEDVSHAEDTNNVDLELARSTEDPQRKKKKREKTKEVNEAEELEMQSNETREEASTAHNEDLETSRSTEEPQRKKKKREKTKEVNEAEELEMQSNETREEASTAHNEDLETSRSTEEPQRKKKKREKTKEANKAGELETQSNETTEEASPKKKKKLKESNENIEEKRIKTEEVGLTVDSERQSNELKKKKKKKNKSVEKERKKVQSVSTTKETQTSQDDKKELTEIDAKLLNELKEFIPDIESKELVRINKMIKYDLPRFKEFKEQGIPLNHGRFTAQENERLRKNVGDFMALTTIDCPTKLFFTHRFKQEQENIKKLKGLHKFFERIAEGIPRSCYYVYARGRRMFDEQNHQGEFSKEELHALNKLHTLHGNNWKKISELTGRSAFSLQKRYTQIANKEGPWSKKEVQRLLRAVRDHIVSQIPGAANSNMSIRVMKETLYKRLPLQRIATKVKTRSWSQCREKWMGILAVKMSFGAVCTEKKSLDVQVKLIKGMYEMDVDDAAHVNWEDLTALIGDVPPAYVQRKWHKMKVCHVPEWQRKCFGDIIDYLYEKVLPDLQNKLMALKDLDESKHTENDNESYLLSDIFQDINEDEDVDDDEEEAEMEVHNDNNMEKETQ